MKHFIAELVGTFFLTFAAVLIGDPLAVGMMFMAMIYITTPLSGGYLNPAISLALWLRGRFTALHFLCLALAQVLGALLVHVLAFGGLGNVIPAKMIPAKVIMFAGAIELLLTFVLVLIVLIVALTNKFRDGHISGLIAGFTLTAITATIGTYNPAIAAGSMIANAVFGTTMPGVNEIIVYLLLPLVAGVLAAFKFGWCYQPQQPTTYQQQTY